MDVEASTMHYENDIEFIYRGHQVQVSHKSVPAEYQGVNDVIFTVLLDGRRIKVPGIWSAYKKASNKGVELVIMAMLDGQPAGTATHSV